MTMNAINPKHQAMVNRAMKHLLKYNELNDQRDMAESNDDDKLYAKLDRKCESAFDKFLECMDELPKRERDQIEASPAY